MIKRGYWSKLERSPSQASLLATLALLLWLSGCNSTPPNSQTQSSSLTETTSTTAQRNQEKKVILTTFTVLADMAQNVAGDKAIVESITKIGSEIHGYEPTPSDLVRGQEADLILDNGLNLERWAEKFYNSLPEVPHITLTEGIQSVEIAEDAYKNKPNPHAWMSPQNALIYVENIRKALVDLDPQNADTYNANAKTYSEKIKELDQKLQKELATLPPNQRYMATCEGAFSYIIRDYGLKELYLWPVNAERQGTPQQTAKVIEVVKENQVPAVFCESTVNDEAQRQVAKESGARFGGVFYVDSLSGPDGPAPTYLKLMERNVTTLINGLQGR